jgi:hypothetical protein
MSFTYEDVKAAVLSVIDDFTEVDVVANYGKGGPGSINAKTKLSKIGITDPVLAIMPIRFNKVLKALCKANWNRVGSLDLVQKETIAEIILLACQQSGIGAPPGEPK